MFESHQLPRCCDSCTFRMKNDSPRSCQQSILAAGTPTNSKADPLLLLLSLSQSKTLPVRRAEMSSLRRQSEPLEPQDSIEEVMKTIESHQWTLAIACLQDNRLQHRLSKEQQKRVLLKAVACQDVGFRNVVIFRQLLDIGFPMDYIDLALSHAIRHTDLDFVDEICEKFSDVTIPRNSFPHCLPVSTKLRIIQVLKPLHLMSYLRGAARILILSVLGASFRCKPDEAIECLLIAMDHSCYDTGLAGYALWRLLNEHWLGELFLDNLRNMSKNEARKMATDVHKAAMFTEARQGGSLTVGQMANMYMILDTGLVDDYNLGSLPFVRKQHAA